MKHLLKISILIFGITFLQKTTAQIQEPLQISREADINPKTYTGIISEHYANGSPSLWKTLIQGKAEGLWLEWYPNGNLRYRAYWKNGLGNGRWEYFHPNGRLRSESFYIDDIAQGFYRDYYENGQLQNDATYLNGKKEGVETSYDIDGVLLSRKRYENGTLVIDEPQIFEEGVVSVANGNEWGITFMPDGNTAYFTRRDINTGQKRIYVTTKTETTWSEPAIAPFSTDEDEAAFITSNGSKFYFASYRPLPDGNTSEKMDMNIWMMDKTNKGWSAPKPLSRDINKSMQKGNVWPANYEAGPMTDAQGNLYYWTKGSETNATNIFMATLQKDGTYSRPIELIPPSSTKNYDTSATLSPDGNLLFFGSDDRYDGFGGSDMYYCVKKGNRWSTPKNLGPVVNSSQSESSPSFSPDGKYFYFSSNRGSKKDTDGERMWDIYYMETRFLLIEK
ncbi:MAG: toxin-antitoxin system YwqK family antitoxin [Flavobacteriaceae bacterium]